MPQRKLLIATHNPGKLREYRGLLGNVPFDLVSLDHLGIAEEVEETGNTFHENARLKASIYAALSGELTLADDSGLEVDALGGEPGVHSARYGQQSYFTAHEKSSPTPNESAPQARPGNPPNPPLIKGSEGGFLNKGRMGGFFKPEREEISDQDRVRLLLRNLEGVPWAHRTARFRCVIAIATPSNPSASGSLRELTLVVGSVAGMIQYEPMGQEGFGYDPVFYLPSHGLTMAQFALEEKNRISHRANAAGMAMRVLKQLQSDQQSASHKKADS